MVLATFGVICRAQMTPQDASGVTSCEIQLASCKAVLGEDGAKEADGLVPREAILAETGTPSSASEASRLRSSPPPIRLPCAGCLGTLAAARVRGASPCRAGSPALVGKNTSGPVPPADTAQYPESTATSCAARLRECRARSSVPMGATSPGEPRPNA